jgi:hypothetical protein
MASAVWTCRDRNGKSRLPRGGAASARQVPHRRRKPLRANGWRPPEPAAVFSGNQRRAANTTANAHLPPPLYKRRQVCGRYGLVIDHD